MNDLLVQHLVLKVSLHLPGAEVELASHFAAFSQDNDARKNLRDTPSACSFLLKYNERKALYNSENKK